MATTKKHNKRTKQLKAGKKVEAKSPLTTAPVEFLKIKMTNVSVGG